MEYCDYGSDLFARDNGTEDPVKLGIEQFGRYYSNIHGYLCVVLCSFGITSNVINLLVLMKPKMRSSVNVVLASIAVCDIGKMITYFAYVLHFLILESSECNSNYLTYNWMVFLLVHSTSTISLHTCSVWLAILVAFIRHVTVNLHKTPLANWLNKLSSAWRLVIVILAVATSLSLPGLATQTIVENPTYYVDTCGSIEYLNATANDTSMAYSIGFSEFATNNNCTMMRFNFWMTGLLFKVVPCGLLAVLLGCLLTTLSVAKKKRRKLLGPKGAARHSGTDHITVMLICVLITFLATEFPQGVLALLIGIYPQDVIVHIYNPLGDFIDVLSLINSCISFFLYCSMSTKYRKIFWEVVIPSHLYQKLYGTGESTFEAIQELTSTAMLKMRNITHLTPDRKQSNHSTTVLIHHCSLTAE